MTKHGGKREGAGRKEAPYKTTVIRIPEELKPKILAMIEAWKRKNT